MTAVLIRIPQLLRNEKEASLREYQETATDADFRHYFRVSKQPKNAGAGDRAYVMVGKEIIGYHLIEKIRFVSEGEAHELSGGDWHEGIYIIRPADSWHPIEPAIPYEKTQGQWTWRYFEMDGDTQ